MNKHIFMGALFAALLLVGASCQSGKMSKEELAANSSTKLVDWANKEVSRLKEEEEAYQKMLAGWTFWVMKSL